MKKILRSVWTWTFVAVLLQLAVLVFIPDFKVKVIVSTPLMLAAFAFIWRMEKYQKELKSNRLALVFAMVALGCMFTILMAYSNLYKWFPNVFN